MQAGELYRDIAARTQGDVYIGVVGPVRTGKSTFIQKFMEKMVIPVIENAHIRARILDELPQSGSGRTVMTTQLSFVPNDAVQVMLPENNSVRLRMIDSVGYFVEGALGTQDGDDLRMVKTPWAEEAIPFERAAEIGTGKVIADHSTMALVITTDGSVTELPREAYVPAESKSIAELKAIGKPFAVILNTANPTSTKAKALQKDMQKEYGVPVIAMDIEKLEEEDILSVLKGVLGQFPISCVHFQTPEWLGALDDSHWLIKGIEESILKSAGSVTRIADAADLSVKLSKDSNISDVSLRQILYGTGHISLQVSLQEGMFNQILAEQCGTEIKSDAHLLSLLCELVAAKREYDHVSQALESVRATGYGLVPPKLEELTLQEPEIIRHGGRFGVRLRASAPSLHMIRVDINTEVSPVVGTEQQSEEMIRYLMEGFEQDPQKLWQSNLFGKPLSDLVREGLSNKLMHMPEEAQLKLQQTLEKIINEGSGGMLCILL